MMSRQEAFVEWENMGMRGSGEGFFDPSAPQPRSGFLPLSGCLQPGRAAAQGDDLSCYHLANAGAAVTLSSAADDRIRKNLEAVGASASVQMRSSDNTWPWADGASEVSASSNKEAPRQLLQPASKDRNVLRSMVTVKMKKAAKTRRKIREPRFCFKTMSEVDVLDDGYKWRKYGQKVVKNTNHPRSYYRCTQDNCKVKKRVERLAEDPRMVITTYEGRHSHLPPEDGDESLTATPPISFFW